MFTPGSLGWVVVVVAALAVTALLWTSGKARLSYHIGRSSLRIQLGRVTVRRIDFTDIERVDKPRRELRWLETENWRNTFDDSRRLLVVHRRRGWFRKLVITPRHRYEFRRQLRGAIAEATGQVLPPVVEEPAESDAD